jgi:hypothetical protein
MNLQVKHGKDHNRLLSNWLDAQYIAADSTTQKYVEPGLVVGQDGVTWKYVPYNVVPGTYGSYCATPVGVTDELVDETLGDVSVTPIFHGMLIEAYCYIYGSAKGNIPAAVKTALADIKWV